MPETPEQRAALEQQRQREAATQEGRKIALRAARNRDRERKAKGK